MHACEEMESGGSSTRPLQLKCFHLGVLPVHEPSVTSAVIKQHVIREIKEYGLEWMPRPCVVTDAGANIAACMDR